VSVIGASLNDVVLLLFFVSAARNAASTRRSSETSHGDGSEPVNRAHDSISAKVIGFGAEPPFVRAAASSQNQAHTCATASGGPSSVANLLGLAAAVA